MQIDHDTSGKTLRQTAPNPSPSNMVTSATSIATSNDSSSLLPRKDSTISDRSRSFGHDETSSDSLFTSTNSSSHYLIKCNVNPSTPVRTTATTTTTPAAATTSATTNSVTPRVKVTVQQPSITARSSRFDMPTTISGSHLKTPVQSMSASTTSSAPEFSLSGASSVDDSDDLTSFDQYKSSAHSRQSNPSPELRKNSFDDWIKLEQRYLPRSKSEINTLPSEESSTNLSSHERKTVRYSEEND